VTAATLPPATEITGPGVYDIPEAEYHARPELSSTGVRKLLPPSCPAKFKHWRDFGDPPSAAFDLGKAAHRVVLGAGAEIVEIEADDWRTKAAREQRDDAREDGLTPLLTADFETVLAMAEALRAHPFAAKLFEPGTGQPEQTLIWAERATVVNEDGSATGVMPVRCRALVDWLPNPGSGRLVLPDFKSCISAAPDDLSKAMSRYGYHLQMCFYLRGLRSLGLAGEDAEPLLVCQEKTPPYLVTVVQPDRDAMRLAEIRIREALDVYAQCVADDRWPGYSDDVVLASLPPWELRELDGAVW
jgi:hypothetical protein